MRTLKHKGTLNRIFDTAFLGRVYAKTIWLHEGSYADPKTGVFTYEQIHEVQALNDAINLLEGFQEGDQVVICCWVNSKAKYINGIVRYFPVLRLKSIELA